MPAYNRADMLPRSINSVLEQTFQTWELIVIDDGSTDETPEVLATFKDSRIRVLRNEPNRERSYSRNRGINEACGQIICFLDSDDEWLPNHLQVHASAWENASNQTGAYFSQTIRIRKGETAEEPLPDPSYFSSAAEFVVIKQPAINTWSVRRDLLLRFPFDAHLFVNEDVVVLTQIASRYKLVRLPDFTASYHMHGNNTHQEGKDTLSPQIQAMKLLFADKAVRKAIPATTRKHKLLHLRHYRAAAVYKWGTRTRALACLAGFILRYPRHPQNSAKLYLLLNRLPLVSLIPPVRRAAAVVIESYY